MTRAALRSPAVDHPWLLGAAIGVAFGAAAVASIELALGVLAAPLLLYGFIRSGVKSEMVVAVFWVSFCLYETVFAALTLQGFFYPFYAAFFVSAAVSLLRTGIRIQAGVLGTYVVFLAVVLVSFVGFTEPIGFEVIQRVFAYVIGLVVMLQFRSWRGIRPVMLATVATGTTIAVWVIATSIQAGFRYRGDIAVDQNVVSFFIGFGVIVALAAAADAIATPGRRSRLLVLLLPLGAMLYALMLLASRGIALALILATAAVVVRALILDRRSLGVVFAVAAIGAGALLLPGSDHLMARFALDDTETGNRRLPIWEALIDDFVQSDPYTIAVGHGFGSSELVVQRAFGSLTSTHNAFLQILYEFGVVGLASFLGLHVLLLWRAYQLRNGRGLVMFGLLWFLVGANLTLNAPDGFMYWTALGVAMALGLWGRAPRRSTEPEAPPVGLHQRAAAGRALPP